MKYTKIIPSYLKGKVIVPPSKSISHRMIICAGLCNGESIIRNISYSNDIMSTIKGIETLGAKIKYLNHPINKKANDISIIGRFPPKSLERPVINCGESASTLRFLIPLSLLTCEEITFTGTGRLHQRPLNIYFDIFDKLNIKYSTPVKTSSNLPLTLCGNLTPGKYKIRGDVSSQFITGLMFALPLLGGDSRIVITTPLESKGYIDLTISALKDCSITIENKNYKEFFIKGGQRYRPTDYYVEGDFSQSAFWLGAGALGADIICENINNKTFQGDKAILEIISNMGGSLEYGENSIAGKGPLIVYDEITIDVSQCPDLAPVIAVLGSLRKGRTKIVNAKRLRLKESDRLKALSEGLGKIGAKIEELPDSLVIEGQETLEGGIVDSNGDHRIVMALAIASMRCKNPVIIKNSDAVNKSYPGFWNDFVKLGGEIFEFDYR